jgi:hypothetical protein
MRWLFYCFSIYFCFYPFNIFSYIAIILHFNAQIFISYLLVVLFGTLKSVANLHILLLLLDNLHIILFLLLYVPAGFHFLQSLSISLLFR